LDFGYVAASHDANLKHLRARGASLLPDSTDAQRVQARVCATASV
jgi:hypothetical protein